MRPRLWVTLRWREPQPITPWKGVRAADTFASACLQKRVSMPRETLFG